MAIINFNNHIEETLWLHELSGQISDGYWENSRPHNHWLFWCNCETTVNFNKPGVFNYNSYEILKNNYNFYAPELLSCVAFRMLSGAWLSIVLGKTLTRDQYDFAEHFAGIFQINPPLNDIDVINIIQKEMLNKENYMIKTYSNSVAIEDLIKAFKYESRNAFTIKDLRKTLESISQIIKTASK